MLSSGPRSWGPVGLGVWLGAPFAALVVLLLAISRLPASSCDGYSNGTSAAELLVTALACLASIACIAAGGYRLGSLLFGPTGISPAQAIAGLGFVGLMVLGGVIYDSGRSVTALGHLLIVGTAATAVAFLALVVALLARRSVNQVGLLLPIYLLGAGLFVYPIFALLALAATRGAFC